ncbi:MAG: PD-(D/E)XK nuclease family protein [Verrucomicrobiales bacterium]
MRAFAFAFSREAAGMELMDGRVFLGWDEPLLEKVLDWLWARREEMPGMCVVVPTAQAGRRLREGLAERGGCLAPRMVTPGYFLLTPEAAPASAEVLAWVEALEDVVDWSRYANLFPSPPGVDESSGWALPLAKSLSELERAMQESAVTLEWAARCLADSVESERWDELAALWRLKERRLADWGLMGRSRLLQNLVKEGVGERVVLAGVPDLPEAVRKRLSKADPIVLIGAPEEEAGNFDEVGRPEEKRWEERDLDWPDSGQVEVVADPHQQAECAVRAVAERKISSSDLALGSADDETAEELVRAFARHGWVVHNPAGGGIAGSRAWLSAWQAWLSKPDVACAIDLLGLKASVRLAGGQRAQRVRALSRARDEWLIRDREDLDRVIALDGRARESLEEASETLRKLENARRIFLSRPFGPAMKDVLEWVDREVDWPEVREWLVAMEKVMSVVKRDGVFWLNLLLDEVGDSVKPLAEGRAVDVQGWLELLHEPGRHLVVCGMNEGRVPSSPASDAWLTEGVRSTLGLTTDGRRAARDAYVFEAITRAREEDSVDVFLAKSSLGGDSLLPSRLLMRARGGELARRVKHLFQEVEPPDAGMSWTLDWKWNPPEARPMERLSVTAFSDYLVCPTRFYFHHVIRASSRDPERVEWNARDFGNVCHVVLENWANDSEAVDFSKSEALEAWLHEELDRVVAGRFGGKVPLAIRIQMEGLRQRLSWFAIKQACERASGWRVEAVEKDFQRSLGAVTLSGKVDRIDRHEDGRKRVLDYKTFAKLKDVEKEHRSKVTKATVFPEHLKEVEEVLCQDAKGKVMRWTNLQVPLYTWAIPDVTECGYFVLGSSEKQVGLSLWKEISSEDLESAVRCAKWVVEQVQSGVFGPPATKVKYDDYEILTAGRTMVEMMKGVQA